MRSLKECYESAKKYHSYWVKGYNYHRFMCLAANEACLNGDLTYEELRMLKEDVWSLIYAINPEASSLLTALGSPTDKEVKAYWDMYIDNMGNQDG